MAPDTSKMKTKDMAISLESILPSLAHSLYGDDWRISIRELLQNCHDALQDRAFARGEVAHIDIVPDPVAGTLIFEDNGVGMTLKEVEKYLAELTSEISHQGQGQRRSEAPREDPVARVIIPITRRETPE